MVLQNVLGITSQVELNRAEEKISKQATKQLFDSGVIDTFAIGTFVGLQQIHKALFEKIYPFAGIMRNVNIAKGHFRFVPMLYLSEALQRIDAMPHHTYNEIIEKYVEMNIAHPFREGNGRATRIWLDILLKKEIQHVIEWNAIDKSEYISAMERSPVNDIEIKNILEQALTDKITEREIFMKGIDTSYYYEGYSEFNIEDV